MTTPILLIFDLIEPTSATDELYRMLADAGIARSDCSATIVCKEYPSWKRKQMFLDKAQKKLSPMALETIPALEAEIARVNPTILIALGPIALQVLTGKLGIMKWRGSEMVSLPRFGQRKTLPTIGPEQIGRMWEWRPLAIRDLQRAAAQATAPHWQPPAWRFHLRPTFDEVTDILRNLQERLHEALRTRAWSVRLSVDIETRGGLTACIGLAWSQHNALCIPLMAVGHRDGYWTADQELVIMSALRLILTHPCVEIIGQNFGYDAQYFAVQAGFRPLVALDTMLMQHTYMLGQKKSLDFIASLYCEQYAYWKDDGKEWDPKIPEEQYWAYNCEDCVRTFECAETLEHLLHDAGLWPQYEFLREMWPLVVRAMLQGVRVDEKRKSAIAMDLMTFIEEVKAEITHILGHAINIASPVQMQALFYTDFGMKVIRNRKTKQPTVDDDALTELKKREPLLTGLIERIQMSRTAGVLLSTFANMPLGIDKRMRCYYNVAGTETLRLSSREDAFGSGGNLQNIPAGDKDKALAKKLAKIQSGHRQLVIPVLKRMFVPDAGKTFFDVDLNRADLMVVIWEADDDNLRQAVLEDVDLHTYNASALFGLSESSIEYAHRQIAKVFAHGTNYGGSARTMAINCGLTIHEADRMQRRWFAEHPGIKEWHRRTEAQLQVSREVRNVFGFRRRYFDRIESVLPEALAWVPQSIVAIVINKGWKALTEHVPEVEVLLQVHDSLAGQFPTERTNPILRAMKTRLEIVVPYAKPLVIGVGISTSQISWGDCKEREWPAPLPAEMGVLGLCNI